MRISQRIYLLFSIPLLVQLLLLGVLTYFAVSWQHELDNLNLSRQRTALSTKMLCRTVDWAQGVISFRATGMIGFSEQQTTSTKELSELMNQLTELCRDDPEEAKITKRLAIAQGRMLELSTQLQDPDIEYGELSAVVTIKPVAELSDLLEVEKQDMLSIVNIEEAKQKVFHERENNSRTLLTNCLYLVIPIYIFATWAAARRLIRDIANRLKVMVENTQRLAKRQALAPVVPLQDEITELDVSFHDMDRRLAELEGQKQSFIAMVTHDLRTPLTSVMLFLELMTSKRMTLETLSEKSKRIYDSVSRLIDMINNLLDMEKIEAAKFELNPQECQLQDLVTKSFNSLETYAESKNIKLKSAAPHVTLVADSDRIIQVLVNLLGNGIKFAPQDGEVSVDAKIIGKEVKVSVSDSGPGIEPEALNTIFNRFEQARAGTGYAGSSGLGLSVAKALVELHGGRIGVDSNPGEGSEFWFVIPLVAKHE